MSSIKFMQLHFCCFKGLMVEIIVEDRGTSNKNRPLHLYLFGST